MQHTPKIAIIDPNTLASLGLRQLLQSVAPQAVVECLGSFSELEASGPEGFVHFFVAMNIVVEHRQFFNDNRHKTIVLTLSTNSGGQLQGFASLCINVPEAQLVKSILQMVSHGSHRANIPQPIAPSPLSDREAEVMSLIVQGLINKEIAARLNISLSTVVTHRKNIMEKLSLRSVSSLTIYAVMHGYVDINKI